ncbi:AVAST type 1 anti-phage system protein Avs1c [Tatumella terrea]|uniref:AVAST type 1 anti-phage system protein Avs1c n=1 Tax=Tatumella terrea TaxID=419007 RepID=A0ABW1W1K6_9GAMM
MNFDTFETPQTRSEFELRFYCLHNIMKQGKFHVGANVSMEGVLKVRKLPNGRIDFLSVNEQARLSANMMYKMRNIEVPSNINSSDSLE